MDLQGQAGQPELLVAERDRLLNAVAHLEASIREIKDAIRVGGPDTDLQEAVGENVVVIAKYRARVASLEQEIKRASGLPTDVTSIQKVAVQVEDSRSIGGVAAGAERAPIGDAGPEGAAGGSPDDKVERGMWL